jgi:uncharacterized repeat protein (TIGR03803 family)
MAISLRSLKSALCVALFVLGMANATALNFQHLCSFRNPPSAPLHRLTLGADGNYFGVAENGNANGNGVIFRMGADGIFKVIKMMDRKFGALPYSELIPGADQNLYGYASAGGGADGTGGGTLFRVSTNGTLKILASYLSTGPVRTPSALMASSDGNLYGLYRVTTNNVPRTALFRLGTNGVVQTIGVLPVLLSAGQFVTEANDGRLYVISSNGGSEGKGVVYRATKAGKVSTFFDFVAAKTTAANPPVGLVASSLNGALYGITSAGGEVGGGTIFKLTTNGVFTTLSSLPNDPERESPYLPLATGNDGSIYTQAGRSIYKVTSNDEVQLFYILPEDVATALPKGVIVANNGNLFSTIEGGGAQNAGSVSEISTAGDLIAYHSFERPSPVQHELAAVGDGSLLAVGIMNMGFRPTTPPYAIQFFQVATNGQVTESSVWNSLKPTSSLTKGDDGNYYGAGVQANGDGAIFRTAGLDEPVIVASFAGSGSIPVGTLTKGNDGLLYGVTSPVESGYPTVFTATTSGVIATLTSFTNQSPNISLFVSADSFVYGTTVGSSETIYRMNPSGEVTTLFATNGTSLQPGLLLASDGNLYGTSAEGGQYNLGMIFRMTPEGEFKTLLSFNGNNGESPNPLVWGEDGRLYGTTRDGGKYAKGTAFQITTNGVFTLLHSFDGTNGAFPTARLTQAEDGFLYGVTPSGGNGSGTVFRLAKVPPTIVSQPLSRTNAFRSSVTFTVGVAGPSPYTYQWLKNGVPIPTAKKGTLTLSNLLYSAAGNYSVIVSNMDGFTLSSNALLTIALPPQIVSQPENDIATVGTTANFSVTATSMLPMTYQWQFKGVPMVGRTKSTLALGNIQTAQAGTYRVVVSNRSGSVTSTSANLTVQTCSYTLSSNIVYVPSAGGAASVTVNANLGDCSWLTANTNTWLTVTSGAWNQGTTDVSFNVAENTSSLSRLGSINAAGKTFQVVQAGAFAPAQATGRTFSFRVLSGGASNFQVVTALKGSNYVRIPALTAPTNYVYQKTGRDTANLSLPQLAVYQLSYETAASGTYVAVTTNSSVSSGIFVVTELKLDFNGDGSADILSQNYDGSLRISYLMRTNYLRTQYLSPLVDYSWSVVGQADFDDDGQTDLLMRRQNGLMLVEHMRGTNFLNYSYLNSGKAVDTAWQNVGLHDLNNDGEADILFQHTTGPLWVWLMTGESLKSSFVLRNGVSPGQGWRVVAMADFNRDGRTDILFEHESGYVSIWFMNGTTYLSSTVLFGSQPVAANLKIVGVNDYNSDSHPDLLLQAADGGLQIWFMNGIGFSSAFQLTADAPQAGWKVVGPK